MDPDHRLAEIMRRIENLPPAERHEAWLEAMARMLGVMEPEQLTAVRTVIAQAEAAFEAEPPCPCGCPRNTGLLELIDGHIALRQIGCIKTKGGESA